MINILVGKAPSQRLGLLAYRPRSIIEGAHTRIQAPNTGALQMLLAATEGDQAMKRDVRMSTEIGRCFSSVPAVSDYACCNLLWFL